MTVVIIAGKYIYRKPLQVQKVRQRAVAPNQCWLGHPGNWAGKNKDGFLAQIMRTLAAANLDNRLLLLGLQGL